MNDGLIIVCVVVVLIWAVIAIKFAIWLIRCRFTTVYPGGAYLFRDTSGECPHKKRIVNTVTVKSVTRDGWVNYSMDGFYDDEWMEKFFFNHIYKLVDTEDKSG